MKKIEDTYYVETVEELRKVQLTQPTENAYKDFQREKKYYKESISNLLPIWELKFSNDVPMRENAFLQVKELVSDKNFKQFDSIKIGNIVRNKNISSELSDSFIKSLTDSYEHHKGTSKLTINLKLDKLDDGNMAGRYLTMGIAKNSYKSNMDVYDVSFEVTDESNLSIGAFRITSIEAGGLFGGINTLESDVINLAKKYLETNYLK